MRTKSQSKSLPQSAYKRLRNQKGNMLVLILAVTMGLVLTLLFFGLNYSRMLGGQAEQKKAVEAAALAAATDLGTIVIDTPEMGYVSLSDQAPVGKSTKAGDQYYMPVRGINTIIGTARLDAILADKLPNSGVMKQLATNDYETAKEVVTKLNDALAKAVAGGSGNSYVDRDGNPVDVAKDAENAYKANSYRITGAANYVQNSLKISLGSLNSPAETNIPIPQPANVENLNQQYISNNHYKSFVNVPYNGVNYVFAGVGNGIRLVDGKQFVDTVPGLEYQIPSIVKVECDELVKTSQDTEGHKVHAIACAQPASTFDPRPAPGALAIEFPDGQVPEFSKPGDLLTKLTPGTTPKTANGGDYPTNPTSSLTPSGGVWPPNLPGAPNIGSAWQTTLYDWLRRGGTKTNLSQAIGMMSSGFAAPAADTPWYAETSISDSALTNISASYGGKGIPMGVSHSYKFDENGNIQYKKVDIVPYPLEAVSENQLYAEVKGTANGAFKSSVARIDFNSSKTNMPKGIRGKLGSVSKTISAQIYFLPYYDMFVRDQSRNLGNTKGGKHGGEPMNDALMSYGVERSNSHITKRIGTDYGAGGVGAGGCDSGGCGGPPCGGPPAATTTTDGTGMGSPPIISAESDFGDLSLRPFAYPPPILQFAEGPSGGSVRDTYHHTGLVGSIRFRREIQFDGNLALANGSGGYTFSDHSDIGFIGARKTGNGSVYTTQDKSDPTGVYADLAVTDDFKHK